MTVQVIPVSQNNATCADQVNGFNCSCAPGFNGPQCETGNLNREHRQGKRKNSSLTIISTKKPKDKITFFFSLSFYQQLICFNFF